MTNEGDIICERSIHIGGASFLGCGNSCSEETQCPYYMSIDDISAVAM